MAYATDGERLYIFGGIGASGLLNDLWEFDTSKNEWKEIKTASSENGPEPCSSAGMIVSNGYAVVCGGDTRSNVESSLKMFRIKIDTNSVQSWEEVKITDLEGNNSNIPVSRSNFGYASFVNTSQAYLYIFGGWSSNNLDYELDSILILDCSLVGNKGNDQKNVTYKEIIHHKQSYLFGDCGCTIDGDGNVFILGGRMDEIINSNILTIMKEDLSIYITEEVINSPEAVDRRENYFERFFKYNFDTSLSGKPRNKQSGSSFFSSSSNFETNTSVRKESIKTKTAMIDSNNSPSTINGSPFVTLIKVYDFAPSPRVNPIVGHYAGTLFVYGGRDPVSGEIFSDMYVYDMKENRWIIQLPEITSEHPPARELASYCFDNGRILIFGGLGPNPSTGKVEPSNELWEYSFVTNTWRQLGKNSFLKPYPVYGASATMYMDYLIEMGGQMADGLLCEYSFVFNFASDKWEFSMIIVNNFKSSILVKEMLLEKNNAKDIPEQSNSRKRNDFLNEFISLKSNAEDIDDLETDDLKRMKNSKENLSGSNIRKNQTLFLFGGNIGTKPFYGIKRDNIYQEFSLSKNGTKSNEADEMKDSSTRKSKSLNIDDVDDTEVFHYLDGAALSFNDTIIMLGGRKRNFVQDTFKYFRIHEDWTIDTLEDDGTFVSNGMHLDIVEAGCTVYDKSVICFGGRQISDKGVFMPNALDTFRVIKLDEQYISCSPGTYEDQDGKCQLCGRGQFSDGYGNKNCTPCPKGTYGTAFGSQKFGCFPVPKEKFSEKEGTCFFNEKCHNVENCTGKQYCPIGSASPNNTIPSAKFVSEQPKPFYPDTKLETIIMIALHGGAIFWVITSFFAFDKIETRTTTDVSMEEEAQTVINNEKIVVELTLMDYSGECIGAPENTDKELSGQCSDNLGLGKQFFDVFDWYEKDIGIFKESKKSIINCTQKPSSNHFYPPTHDCKITVEANELSLKLENPRATFFSLFSSEREASCRALKVRASVDSAVPVQKKTVDGPDNYQSIMENIYVSDEEHVIHGSNPTNITLKLIPSIYKDEMKIFGSNLEKGHLINQISFDTVSLADDTDIYFSVGFGVNVQIKIEKNVAVTEHLHKSSLMGLVALIGGALSYFRLFGIVVCAADFGCDDKCCGCCGHCRCTHCPCYKEKKTNKANESDLGRNDKSCGCCRCAHCPCYKEKKKNKKGEAKNPKEEEMTVTNSQNRENEY
ncbi:uncharacterized protein MONOS_12839 [Monocercomonoides exilis]|uniref:uncharacterized protein n=1 Tax=Monocercomonoides exilis TaxID=2049356 RepID=UPI00355AB675|nr:hypothetical protein MONOS_12839 [Monocercomonoides exilis]|eukprot:MONOS_12839.1-p1 / transcript=MONOS_12839.1 / gene=MONOS_12839 / organism=Monocercomonoides_exilis_PA203 / gene_product=unspecified product / transcript_product=unspecified product / location=Mono_scaffold00740:27846-31774(+) / protein_length=1211 / sequence_SO=supercontig / SO=protein_coding / is_pseudo=false